MLPIFTRIPYARRTLHLSFQQSAPFPMNFLQVCRQLENNMGAKPRRRFARRRDKRSARGIKARSKLVKIRRIVRWRNRKANSRNDTLYPLSIYVNPRLRGRLAILIFPSLFFLPLSKIKELPLPATIKPTVKTGGLSVSVLLCFCVSVCMCVYVCVCAGGGNTPSSIPDRDRFPNCFLRFCTTGTESLYFWVGPNPPSPSRPFAFFPERHLNRFYWKVQFFSTNFIKYCQNYRHLVVIAEIKGF
jgi:hypothetical protein